MKRLLAATAVLAGCSFASTALACSCALRDQDPQVQISDGAVVARGTVQLLSATQREKIYLFNVEAVVNSSLPSSIEISTAADDAACGVNLPEYELVYLKLQSVAGQERYAVDKCGQAAIGGRIAEWGILLDGG